MVQLKVVNCPNQDLALTNRVFCSPMDRDSLGGYVEMGGVVYVLEAYQSIEPSCIALNAIQRRMAKVSAGDPIRVEPFAPPRKKFELMMVTLDLDYVKAGTKGEPVDAPSLAKKLQALLSRQVLTLDQKVTFEFMGSNYLAFVSSLVAKDMDAGETAQRGILGPETTFLFQAVHNSGIKVANQRSNTTNASILAVDFEKLGIGGMDRQLKDMLRRAFVSRAYPPHVVKRLGIIHVKGMLLYGPPGTGKTLIARNIGKLFSGKEPKIVNGPELLNKYVGQSEENVRNLFKEAEEEQMLRGDDSELHIIIFDEIDSVCKARGSSRDGTGVGDSVVNQLLTKIDGVNALNNILLIGMTNRKDLLDEALLRPGRMEVQIEIGLPDEHGRQQILRIKTDSARQNSFMSPDVDLLAIAQRTKNFSGAEIEGLVKSAVSFALARQVDPSNPTKPVDEEAIKVAMADFEQALSEVQPAFGASVATLERCRLNGWVSTGESFEHLVRTCKMLVEQVRTSENTPLLTMLLEGPSASGKTALAATLALEAGFPFVKLVSNETMVGWSETSKCQYIAKVFDDAYKSDLSIIVLDDIERLLDYVSIGPRFSNVTLQALLTLLKRNPPEGKKLLVIGTSSEAGRGSVLEEMAVNDAFNVCLHVPLLGQGEMRAVLQALDVFSPAELEPAVALLGEEMGIKNLLMLLEMARQGGAGGKAAQRISLQRFRECIRDLRGR